MTAYLYLLPFFYCHKAGELRDNGVLLADVDDVGFPISFQDLTKQRQKDVSSVAISTDEVK